MAIIFIFGLAKKYEFFAENEGILDRIAARLSQSVLLDLKMCQNASTNHDKKRTFLYTEQK